MLLLLTERSDLVSVFLVQRKIARKAQWISEQFALHGWFCEAREDSRQRKAMEAGFSSNSSFFRLCSLLGTLVPFFSNRARIQSMCQ
jgi:hypothetical protein